MPVTAAVKAVVIGKNITEQKIVDVYPDAIEQALKTLEKKSSGNTGENPKTGDSANYML